MENPFERYIPIRDGDTYSVKEVFKPNVQFTEDEFSLQATVGGKTHTIYSVEDIINWHGKVNGSSTNFKGLIGERILSVVLEELIDTTVSRLRDQCGEADVCGKVLRELEKHEGRNFAVTYDNKFLLRYDGRTNFVVLKKTPLESPDSWYQQEYLGLQSSEIDGLAYLHHGPAKYLLLGEVKTISSWKNIHYLDFCERVTEELFIPFKSLFPRHELMFLFMGGQDILFSDDKLKYLPKKLTEQLSSKGINTIFAPFPPTPRSLDEYSEKMSAMLPLTRKILESLGR
jgi:hypothetical protein